MREIHLLDAGGGKADMAEGGGNQPEKLGEALQASYGVIEKMLK